MYRRRSHQPATNQVDNGLAFVLCCALERNAPSNCPNYSVTHIPIEWPRPPPPSATYSKPMPYYYSFSSSSILRLYINRHQLVQLLIQRTIIPICCPFIHRVTPPIISPKTTVPDHGLDYRQSTTIHQTCPYIVFLQYFTGGGSFNLCYKYKPGQIVRYYRLPLINIPSPQPDANWLHHNDQLPRSL